MHLSILHISDLHYGSKKSINSQVLLDSLERDRERYVSCNGTQIKSPDIIIVSGDIIQGVKFDDTDAEKTLRKQYDEALEFLNTLTDRFVEGNKQRVILVPGNHDVSDYHFRQSITATPIDTASKNKKELASKLFEKYSTLRWSWHEFSLYTITDQDIYHQRFAAFIDFYNRFYDETREYSPDPDNQFDVFHLPDLGIVVIGFCSCYNNDILNKQGAINPNCIALVSNHLRKLSGAQKHLRIAVWHHNIEGRPTDSNYMDPDVVQNLIDSGFSIGFHGHQHKPQFLDTRFRHAPDRGITVISAGTLCGDAAFRHGCAYNIVELNVPKRKGRLHVREMSNDSLDMPIWGTRPLPPSQDTCLEFTFDLPPKPFIKEDISMEKLVEAQKLYDRGEYHDAANILSKLSDDLARPLLLDCLIKLDDNVEIARFFDPPKNLSESIALLDALWEQGKTTRISEILNLPLIVKSEDPVANEVREKYTMKLAVRNGKVK